MQSYDRIAGARLRPMVTTMRDIARVAGVSQSTVSRVLNDAATSVPIAAETRARVLRAAADLGYRPNPLARGLRGAPDDAHRRGRPRLQRPVLRGRDRGPRGRGDGPRLQHRARPRPGPARRGHRADDGPRDPAHRRDRAARRHAGPAAPARRPARARRSRSWPCGRAPARSSSRPPSRTTGPGSAPAWSTSSALGHRRIAFVSAHLQGDFRQREDAYQSSWPSGSAACRTATSSGSRTRWPAARRPSAPCSSCPSRRPPCAPRPTSSPSARSTPRT